jgi:hypothetical protein
MAPQPHGPPAQEPESVRRALSGDKCVFRREEQGLVPWSWETMNVLRLGDRSAVKAEIHG